MALTTVLGYLFAIPLPGWLGIRRSGARPGLTASAGIAGWVEMLLLRRTMNARIGRTGLPAELRRQAVDARRWPARRGLGIKAAAPALHPVITGAL